MKRLPMGVLWLALLTSCGTETKMPLDARDVHSYRNPEQVRVRSAALDLTVSFEKKTLSGTVILGIDVASGKDALVLDTRDLAIESIESSGSGASYAPAEWTVGERDAILGSPLKVNVPAGTSFVRVKYSSKPEASGLQWLTPQQTAGKKQPFLFSQNQSIHARSWIPIQDSPGVRVTYTARIHAPEGLVALMSAEHKGSAGGVFDFAMDTPVPAYLIALAVGDLQFQSAGPRTGVYAEPSVLAKAAAEFSDMEKMVAAVEGLYGPYRWGRYDLLILPPSFPFGGMENPRLTFATPTVIAGDKSLVGLVSHELAHSWSGNLVTNATWTDFWLNEGFTTYIENRIQEAVYGTELAEMEQVLDRRKLDDELAELPREQQALHSTTKDPDEGVTQVPYVKGSLFVRLLEKTYGRATLDAYLRGYFDHFAFRSITTAEMLEYLQRELLDKQSAKINIQEWVNGAGLPDSAPKVVSARLEAVGRDAKAFAETGAIPRGKWSTQEWLEFLGALPPLNAAQAGALDRAFRLTQAGNGEILDKWLEIAIQADYAPANPRVETFLMEVGRQKFIRPLYTAMMKTPEGAEQAKAIYARARAGYHPIAQAAVDKIVR